MTNYSLAFAKGFDDYASIIETKGWYPEARRTFSGKQYRLTFYDPFRLRQEIEAELQRGRAFFEPNLVIVPSVNRQNMEKAIEYLIQSGGFSSLSPE